MTLKEFREHFNGFAHIVMVDEVPSQTYTMQLADYLSQPGAQLPERWRGYRVLDRSEVERHLASAAGALYDPWDRRLYPPDEAEELWAEQHTLLYAAHWGVSTSPACWKGARWSDAEDLLADQRHGHPGIPRLLAAFAAEPDSVRAAAKERATTATTVRRVSSSAPAHGTVIVLADRHTVQEVVMCVISARECGRILDVLGLTNDLPNPDMVAPVVYFEDAMSLLRRTGLLGDFLRRLQAERPHRLEIQALYRLTP